MEAINEIPKPKAKAKQPKKPKEQPTKKTQTETLREHIDKKTFKTAIDVFNNAIKHLQKQEQPRH